MKFHELTTTRKPSGKRVGRGISAGGGKTAGRGTKGQNSRTGNKFKPGFEGGQTKLAQRLPKARGPKSGKFHPMHTTEYEVVNIGDLETLGKASIDNAVLHTAKLIRKPNSPVKLLGSGNLTKKVTVKLQAASASAIAAVEKVGGSFAVTEIKKSARDTIKQSKNQPKNLSAEQGANEKRTKA